MSQHNLTDKLYPNAAEARQIIKEAFDEDGTLCYETLKQMQDKEKIFPEELILLARKNSDLAKFNQRIKRQHADEPFSSPLDWRSPERNLHEVLVDQPLSEYKYEISLLLNSEYDGMCRGNDELDESTLYCKIESNSLFVYAANGLKDENNCVEFEETEIELSKIPSLKGKSSITQNDLNQALPEILAITAAAGVTRSYIPERTYLHLELGENQLDYSIKAQDGKIHRGDLDLGGCQLIHWDKTVLNKDDSFWGSIPYHPAIILQDDGHLYWFHRDQAGGKTIQPLSSTTQEATQLIDDIKKLKKEKVPGWASKSQREAIRTLLTQSGHQPVMFEIDEVEESLKKRRQNQNDGKLDTVIKRIKTAVTPTDAVENYDRGNLNLLPTGRAFLKILQPSKGLDISHVLSNEELFRYYMAYMHVMQQTEKKSLPQRLAAFGKEMRQKILDDTIADIKRLLEQSAPQYPKETRDLAYVMMDGIRSNDNKDQQILDLRTLRQFLQTSWAKGTALTEDVATEPLDALEQTIGPYAKQKVEEPQPLSIDARSMPNYAAYKSLFQPFEKQILQYNAKVEVSQARAAIKTKFYVPVNQAEWKHDKRTKRNCFILYKNQLYHVSSDKTLTKLPLNLPQTIWPGKNFSQEDLSKQIQIKTAPLSSQDKSALSDDGMFLIHDDHTNTYTIGYKENKQYKEKSLNTLLGEHVPFDPNLTVAKTTLERALKGTTVFDYLQAVRGQMPRFGKYFSLVHQGKLNAQVDYKFAQMPAYGRIEKGTIYLYQLVAKGPLYYAMITPTGEKIFDQPLKTPVKVRNLEELNADQALKEAIVNEIAEKGHARKKSHFTSAPDTMAYKLNTEAGYRDAMKNYRHAREKQRAFGRAFAEDKAAMGGMTASRREGVLLAKRMARGELTSNHHLNKRPCGMAQYMTKQANDLRNDPAFLNCFQGKGQDMYYLQVVPQGNRSEPVALYFVDRSGDVPVVTQVEAKETAAEKTQREMSTGGMMAKATGSLSKASGAMSAATVKEDQQEFYQNLYEMLQAVKEPGAISGSDMETNPWKRLGRDHAKKGGVIRYVKYDKGRGCTEEERQKIFYGVLQQDEVWVVDSPDECDIFFRKEKTCASLRYEKPLKDQAIIDMIGELSSARFSSDRVTNTLNDILKENGSSTLVPSKTAEITMLSPELEEAINAETKEARKATIYDDQLNEYAHHEISNQLSYVLAQRRALWERYQIEATKNQTSSELQTEYVDYETLSHLLDKFLTKKPDIKQLNQDILAEQYQIKRLDQATYEKLLQWMNSEQKNAPPLLLEKDVFYLFEAGDSFACLGLTPSGKLVSTGMKPSLGCLYQQDHSVAAASGPEYFSEKKMIKNLLPLTEQVHMTLPGHLVDEAYLDRCEEAQRFLDKVGHKAYEGIVSTDSVLPQEKREKLLSMMTKISIDPTSKEAAHYLRDHHKMYITQGLPKAPNSKDNMPPSFYLDVADPENPKLYRFITDENNKFIPVPVKLDNYFTTTPEKELYKIAQIQLGKNNVCDGAEVQLECRDVYYHITNQSTEALKMDTALEMIEEIYQAEFGSAKVIENVIFGLMAAGAGLTMLLMGNPMGAIPILGVIMIGFKALFAGLAFLGTLSCMRAAVTRNGWFDGGLSELKQKLSHLNTLKILENKSQNTYTQLAEGLQATVGGEPVENKNKYLPRKKISTDTPNLVASLEEKNDNEDEDEDVSLGPEVKRP